MRLRTFLRPAYLARRVFYEIYRRLHPDEPWLAQGAVRFLEKELRADMAGWEWGSGSSTLWFGQRIARLTSIEHDPAWHRKVAERIKNGCLSSVDLRLIPLEHAEMETYANDYPRLPNYAAAILDRPDGSLDFVLVDGWYRPVCARASLSKLKPGALLVIDNTDWQHPPHVYVPPAWPLIHRSRNVLTETSIWRRP